MNNVGVIDTFLNTFTTYIDSGFGLIKGEVGLSFLDADRHRHHPGRAVLGLGCG